MVALIASLFLGKPTLAHHALPNDSIGLPFDASVDSNWMIVYQVGINGKGPFTCLFDTGAAIVVLNPSLVKELGIKPEEATQISAPGSNSVKATGVVVDRLQLGTMSFPGVPAVTLPLPKWFPFRCVFGGMLLSLATVRLDFDKKELRLFSPDTFTYAGVAGRIPLGFDSRYEPTIQAVVDGVPGRFLVDTGFAGSISINSSFVRAHHLIAKYPHSVESGARSIAGVTHNLDVRTEKITIGPFTLNGPVASLESEARNDFPGADGVIGLRLLCRFNIVFDAVHKQAFLEPRSNIHEPFAYSRAGMGVDVTDVGLTVRVVAPNGPAAQAGVQVGDRIVGINGSPAGASDAITLVELEAQPVGTKLALVLQRGSATIPVEITLREVL